MDCLFCKIAKKEISSYTIYEDEDFIVFLDLNPVTQGHLLIVPKEHFENILDLQEDLILKAHLIAKKMIKILEIKLGAQGFTLTQNNGLGQDIKHYHLHLIPRYEEKIKEKIDLDSLAEKLQED